MLQQVRKLAKYLENPFGNSFHSTSIETTIPQGLPLINKGFLFLVVFLNLFLIQTIPFILLSY